MPQGLGRTLSERTPNFYKWAQAVIKHPSVASTYNEETVVQGVKDWIAKMKGR